MLKNSLLSELSALDDLGLAQSVGVVLQQDGTAGARVLTVPNGQCFLIEQVAVQAEVNQNLAAGGFDGSPSSPFTYGLSILDSAAAGRGSIQFLAFMRRQQVFEVQDSPNWRNAPPGNVITWRPKFPIPVPEGWTIQNTAGGAFGQQCAVYGRFVSKDAARTLGYNASSSTTDTNARQSVISIVPTASPVTNVTGRTGYCIRIHDIRVRIQPQAAGGTTNKVQLRQVDDRVIFTWTNNNPSDLLDITIHPEIYLKSGQGIESVASIASTASITISYEFVPVADVPGDAWWSYIEPDLPTPSVTKSGTFSNIAQVSQALTCYYPRLDSDGLTATKTTPTNGYQHMVRGYAFNIQKSTTVASDQVAYCLSTGAAAGGFTWAVGGLAGQTNFQISPVISAPAHDQCVAGAVSDLNIPCKKDDGAIYVDAMAVGPSLLALTPAQGDASVDEWSWTVWGKTIPSRFTNPTNQGA